MANPQPYLIGPIWDNNLQPYHWEGAPSAGSRGAFIHGEVGKSAALDVSQSIGHAGADLNQGIGF